MFLIVTKVMPMAGENYDVSWSLGESIISWCSFFIYMEVQIHPGVKGTKNNHQAVVLDLVLVFVAACGNTINPDVYGFGCCFSM